MKKPKPRIYLDTSVISYHTARLHRDPIIRSRQLTTRRWWETFHNLTQFCVSTYVLEEIAKGDQQAASLRKSLIHGAKTLDPTPDTEKLARRPLRELGIPQRSEVDACHLAVAAMNRIDYIVSWNFKHMANDGVREAYDAACKSAGLAPPEIMTPQTMLNQGDKT
jgi:hypothetical protein